MPALSSLLLFIYDSRTLIRNILPGWGFINKNSLPQFSSIDEISIPALRAPGRGDLTASRLEEHLHATVKRLKKFGIGPGASIASVLPAGPDTTTAEMTAKLARANFIPLTPRASSEIYQALLFKAQPKLLLLPSGPHPARDPAHSLGIPMANVLRHFEAGVFTLEAEIRITAPPAPAWKNRAPGVPVVLIAPGPAYRRLANRLDAVNPVIGITPPSLEHLPLPHTFEHIAAECVRILRRYRPQGPYALAGWRIDGLVALEMARLLEEEGDKVIFVAMLDVSSLFDAPQSLWRKILRRKRPPPCAFMAEALRQYRARPWFGKILHLRPSVQSDPVYERRLDWRSIAPQGIASYPAPAEMLAEPNVQTVATILAAELVRAS